MDKNRDKIILEKRIAIYPVRYLYFGDTGLEASTTDQVVPRTLDTAHDVRSLYNKTSHQYVNGNAEEYTQEVICSRGGFAIENMSGEKTWVKLWVCR